MKIIMVKFNVHWLLLKEEYKYSPLIEGIQNLNQHTSVQVGIKFLNLIND